MHDDTEDSVDLWREVASAVEYIAAMERPGFTVWDAVSEAIEQWLAVDTPSRGGWVDADRLRSWIDELVARLAPAGAAGDGSLAAALGAAMSDWLRAVEFDANRRWSFAARPPS